MAAKKAQEAQKGFSEYLKASRAFSRQFFRMLGKPVRNANPLGPANAWGADVHASQRQQ
jgi:hypothetical protein